MSNTQRSFRAPAVAAFAALAVLLPATVMAQGRVSPDSNTYQAAPRPDFPAAKRGDTMQSDPSKVPETDAAQSPRPDFPGPKKSDGSSQK
jgi:hypothetical protein